MFLNDWVKVLFLFVLVGFLFASLSFSFASDDLDQDSGFLSSDYEENIDLVANVDVDSSSSSLEDSLNPIFSEDDDSVSPVFVDDDTVFNDVGDCVDNFMEDSRDDGLDELINPRLDPLDDRVVSQLEVSSFSKYYLNGTQLVGYLKDDDGNPLADRIVSVGIVGVVYNRTTDSSGMFYLNINLYPNNYTANISFDGDEVYAPCSKNISVKVFTMPTSVVASDLVKYYHNGSHLYARLLDVGGNPLVNRTLVFKINNVRYNCTTNASGYAVLHINLMPCVVNFTISFSKSGYKSSQKVVKVTVYVMPTTIVSSDLLMHYKDGSKWIARLLDVHGNPLVNKTLVFKIGSANYTQTTDDEGYASLLINLPPCNANCTVSFKENYYVNVSKKVNIHVLNPPVPSVNVESGVYNCSSLFVNFSAYHENASVFCSFDNGSTWYNATNNLCFNFCEGNWSVLAYVRLDGYNSSNCNYDYDIGDFSSFVWIDKGSGIYRDSFEVHFNCFNPNLNPNINPTIFYTLDGTDPTLESNVYSSPIFISNQSNKTVLKFFIKDINGFCSDVGTVYYFFGDFVANLNNGKIFSDVKCAIEDNETIDGDVLVVSCDTFGSVVLNKSLYLRACGFKPVFWYGKSDEPMLNIVCDNVVVDGFNFTGSNVISLNYVNNCSILNNFIDVQDGYALRFAFCSFCNSLNNVIYGHMDSLFDLYVGLCNNITFDNDLHINFTISNLTYSSLYSCYQVVLYGSNMSLACLSSSNGPLVDREVLVKIDGVDYTVCTDSCGDVYLPIDLSLGLHTIIFYFKGDEHYLSSYNYSKIHVINCSEDIFLSISEDDGFYDCSNLLVNFSSNFEDSVIFCSFDNGTSWSQYEGNVCYNLSEGVWNVLAYCSLYGFNSSVCHCSFVVGNSSPLVWVSNGSGIYNESFEVNLSAFSSFDDDVLIYYTLDGSLPSCDSLLYNCSFVISNQSGFTNLSFFAVDSFGHCSDIVSVYYFFGECIANLNSGKVFSCIQDAIFDEDTVDGDVIETSMDLNEFVLVNKDVSLRSCDFKRVLWTYDSYEMIYLDNVSDVVIERFDFYLNYNTGILINLGGSSNCVIVDNVFLNKNGVSIFDWANSFNNSILFNRFYSVFSFPIWLEDIEGYSFIGNSFNAYDSNENLISSFIDQNLSYNCSISINDCVNSIFYDNEFFNGSIGININDGSCNYFANNMFSNNFKGMSLYGFNNSLFNNSFVSNEFAIVLDGLNNSVVSNTIVNNSFGVFSNDSLMDSCVNFNRIVDNSVFGVYVLDGSVNLTNNWWGHNDIILDEDSGDLYFVDGLGIVYEPYLVLGVYVGDYKIGDFFVMNCSFVADLTCNSFGEDVSAWGCVPGCDVRFERACEYYIFDDNLVYENLFNVSSLVCGKASSVFDLKLNNDLTVFLDNEEVSYFIEYPLRSRAQVFISSSAIYGDDCLDLFLNFPFNDSVNWFSVIWKSVGLFEDEIFVIANGDIIGSFVVSNSFYKQYRDNYSSNVFEAIRLYNKFLYNNLYNEKSLAYAWISLLYGLDDLALVEGEYISQSWDYFTLADLDALLGIYDTDVSGVLLSLLKNSYNLSDDEISFVESCHDMFLDNVTVDVSYLGGSGSSFNVHCEDGVESFAWMGDRTCRSAVISYDDGTYAYTVGDDSPVYYDDLETVHCSNGTVEWFYHNSYGYYAEGYYDGFLTFTFASDKVSDDVLGFWLGEKNRTVNGSLYYDVGFMKAAFGGFIECLDVIYCSDLCADVAAERFNVTWVRTSPMVMSVRDDMLGTVMSGESSFYFGRTAYGGSDDVRSFYFACSSSFSPIEHYVGHALFPNEGNNGSATVGLGFILDSGGEIEIVQDGDLTLIREVGCNDKVLVFDSVTGLLRDQIVCDFSGAYCYSDQQCDWGCDFGWDILNAKEDIWNFVFNNSVMDWANNDVLGIVGSVSMSVGIACLPAFPVGTAVGLGLIGFGLYSTYYADDLNRGITGQRLTHFGADIFLSFIPFVGPEGKIVKTVVSSDAIIGKIVLSKGMSTISDKIVTRSSFAFEQYLIERGETELLYNGLNRASTKFGTLESAFKTRYGCTFNNQFSNVFSDYAKGKFYHYNLNLAFDDYNFEDAFYDTFDLRFLGIDN